MRPSLRRALWPWGEDSWGSGEVLHGAVRCSARPGGFGGSLGREGVGQGRGGVGAWAPDAACNCGEPRTERMRLGLSCSRLAPGAARSGAPGPSAHPQPAGQRRAPEVGKVEASSAAAALGTQPPLLHKAARQACMPQPHTQTHTHTNR